MEANEFYRRLRYALQLDDEDTVRLFAALSRRQPGAAAPDPQMIAAWRQRAEAPEFVAMTQTALGTFIDALILHYRGERTDPADGPEPARSAPSTVRQGDNNTLLKGVRVALSLRVEDIVACIAGGGGNLGKAAVSAFFRKPGSRNYRACGDQVLRQFLKGLALAQRGSAQ